MSCVSNNSDINETFIIETIYTTGETSVFSACTAIFSDAVISCSGDAQIELLSGETIFNTNLVPLIDGNIDLGTNTKRFRDINTISGSSTVWVSTSINTTSINLGLDSGGNARIITADSSVLADDTLLGGSY